MTKEEIRLAAEADLITFIRLVAPSRVLGQCHEDVIRWWEREDAKSHQLLLFPRDHMKSALIAFRVAWYLTRDPTLRILYISATSRLAEKQLSFIKGIMTSEIYRRYWPDHINEDEGKREKWTNTEICLDHPLRREENVRDPSIFTAGLTTNIVGMHCDISVFDDVVVGDNAYTREGRDKVEGQYSLLASIEGAEAKQWVVGTRYHPLDLYHKMMEMEQELFDDDGEVIGSDKIYEVYERTVESIGDGSGEFLWPRQQRKDGKWFGFDRQILARKRGQYLDRLQFRAQYYNDPSDPENRPIDYSKFQYYDQKHLKLSDGYWFFKDRKLNLVAAVDFAFSTRKAADFTAIVVIGVDFENNIYVLDIDRFKTDKISEYYEHILRLYNKWGFRKIRAEVTVAQSAIVNELKINYIRPNGLALKIEEHRPNKYQGAKEERMAAILEPRYDNLQVWHYRGGNIQTLEEELVHNNPSHDDVKDSLASAIEIAVAPSRNFGLRPQADNVVPISRFGGI